MMRGQDEASLSVAANADLAGEASVRPAKHDPTIRPDVGQGGAPKPVGRDAERLPTFIDILERRDPGRLDELGHVDGQPPCP